MASGSPTVAPALPARMATPSGEDKHGGIEPEVPGERFVQPDEAGRGDGGGWQTRKEALRQPRVAVVEGKDVRWFD